MKLSWLAGVLAGVLSATSPSDLRFERVGSDAWAGFNHQHGGTGMKYLVETMGSGGGFFDYDNDGDLDLYLVQSGPHREPRPGNELWRNEGDGRFVHQPDTGAEDTGYGMGCTFGDVDNDGFTDIYVTNFGRNALLMNQGDGRFVDVTRAAGVEAPQWSTSAAFADIDADGHLDLYVANYLEFSLEHHKVCGDEATPSYCHPDVYPAVANAFFRNRGDGTFERAEARFGLVPDNPAASKSLGVLFSDLDQDGDVDLYVANDSTANFLFDNNGGRFKDVSLISGTAYNGNGRTEAGMGVDAADVDGDGLDDLIVTHLDFETNTLYRNEGGGLFSDRTAMSGLGGPSRTRVGFGVNFGDFDQDGWIDLFVANGHVIDNIALRNPTLSHAQADQVFHNEGAGRFSDVSATAGPDLAHKGVSRGSALGDIDGDGDLDVLVTQNNGPAALLRNISATGGWLQLQLVGTHCNRSAIGATATVRLGERSLRREVRSGTSYLSQNGPALHFGLGTTREPVSVEIRWPCGRRQSVTLAAGRRHTIRES